MEFLYSAYYNGNISEDKVKFIEKLGYHLENFYPKQSENTGVATSSNTRGVHFIPKSLFFNSNPHISWNISGRINCWKNWDMFTKIISISDTPNQFSPVIIENVETSEDFPHKKGDIIHLNEIPPYIFIDYRYATLVDIIRYFDDVEKEH